jgi:hypothetical protein
VYHHALARRFERGPIKYTSVDTANFDSGDHTVELGAYDFNDDWSAQRICANILNRGQDIVVGDVLKLVDDLSQGYHGQNIVDHILGFLDWARPGPS